MPKSTVLRCERCDIEKCSEKCSEDKIHSEYECGIVAERKGKVNVALLLRSLLCLRFVFPVKTGYKVDLITVTKMILQYISQFPLTQKPTLHKVTHHVCQNLPLTLMWELRISVRTLYSNATCKSMSRKRFDDRDVSPCIKLLMCICIIFRFEISSIGCYCSRKRNPRRTPR